MLQAYVANNATALSAFVNAEMAQVNVAWMLMCGFFVVAMLVGYVVLEAGTVRTGQMDFVFTKNFTIVCFTFFCYWIIGHALAFGKDEGGFFGTTDFADSDMYYYSAKITGAHRWFFQSSFSAIAAVLLFTSLQERVDLASTLAYTFFFSSWVWPVIAHWIWGQGWLSAWGAYPNSNGVPRPIFKYSESSNGFIDHAGSAVVHLASGFSGLVGVVVLGPRKRRSTREANPVILALGTLLVWFGSFGSYAGWTVFISEGRSNAAGKVVMNTAICCSSSVIFSTLITYIFDRKLNYMSIINGVLIGLVAISGACSVVKPWSAPPLLCSSPPLLAFPSPLGNFCQGFLTLSRMAFLIGLGAAVFLFAGHTMLEVLSLDDPREACIVHGFGGLWGSWSTGIFCTDSNVRYAGYPNVNTACRSGEQFGVQVVGTLVVILWASAFAGIFFFVIRMSEIRGSKPSSSRPPSTQPSSSPQAETRAGPYF
ncbi:ammonium transporter [Guillardia theta CCMP2712]|uniref:Ammonium transporter n=1 Tax=Guillardia theta (strain CCMP2712) TaxID=905079 RepID=L1JGM2_GUITC|nr:ammonium transporter [Guillardia theta CCMP2712]EKX47245.1 ammonium transporter [Guillardia theta CCMP2712]|eukprot:XP_005834225.1 ammonium transporter [Guillardia theta CCMP2712]